MLKQIEIDKYNLCGWRYLFKKYCVDVGYGKKHYFTSGTALRRIQRRNLQILESRLLYSSFNYKPIIEKQIIEDE